MGSAVNFDKLCRICTAELPEGVLIFSEVGKKLCLEAKLKKYLHISVSSEDNLPKILCMNCCKKLDSIHKFASMAVKMQDKLKMLVETGTVEDMKEHSILHSILSKGPESECEVTEVEVRVDPMLFLCALEDGSSDGEDNSNSNETTTQPSTETPVKMEPAESGSSSSLPASEESIAASTSSSASTSSAPTRTVSAVVSTATTASVSTAASTVSAVSSPVILRQTSPQPAMPEKETKPYICSVCSRGFYNEIGLQNHLWSHLPQDRRVLSNTVGNNLERSVEAREILGLHDLVLKCLASWKVNVQCACYRIPL